MRLPLSLTGTTLERGWRITTEQSQVASNWANGSLWVIVVFIGAFVLFGAIAWSRAQNKKRSAEAERRTEQTTHDLYQQQNRDDQLRDR